MKQVFLPFGQMNRADDQTGGTGSSPVVNPQSGADLQAQQALLYGRPTVAGAIYGKPSQAPVVSRNAAPNTPVYAPPFDARFNIDTRFPSDRNKRAPIYVPEKVLDVRRYVNLRDNSPRVAINQGSIHLSYPQLKSAGIHYPEVMIGKTIMLDFFKPGDILLNGSPVADDGRIVNRFVIEHDLKVAQEIETKLAMEEHEGWASLVSQRYGANTRGTGSPAGSNLGGGVNTFIPQQQGPQTRFMPNATQQEIDDVANRKGTAESHAEPVKQETENANPGVSDTTAQ